MRKHRPTRLDLQVCEFILWHFPVDLAKAVMRSCSLQCVAVIKLDDFAA